MRSACWLGITAASALLATLVGCGGAGAGASASGPPLDGTVNTKEQATARVDVDLASGSVKVTPMNPGQTQSRSLFTG